MKKITLLLSEITLIFLLFIQCKREEADYRIKYLGDYNFNTHLTIWRDSLLVNDKLFSSHGKVSKSDNSQSILIFYSSYNIEATLNEDGSFRNNNPYFSLSGEFESISKIKFTSVHNITLGNRDNEDVTGTKKE